MTLGWCNSRRYLTSRTADMSRPSLNCPILIFFIATWRPVSACLPCVYISLQQKTKTQVFHLDRRQRRLLLPLWPPGTGFIRPASLCRIIHLTFIQCLMASSFRSMAKAKWSLSEAAPLWRYVPGSGVAGLDNLPIQDLPFPLYNSDEDTRGNLRINCTGDGLSWHRDCDNP